MFVRLYFFIRGLKNQGKSKYILNFTDKKGGIVFFFDKVMADNELDKYNTNTYHDPFEDEFSKEDMRYLMGWFTFYLAGFIESYQADYREEFFRSIHDGLIVYGYKQDNFFCKSYQDEDSFYKIIGNLKQENIPYNQVMPNE